MNHNFPFRALLLGVFWLFSATLFGQFVNFEETWQEFLKNNKISNTSELTRPSKEDKIDYAKYSLMYANSNFCQSRIGESESHLSEIRNIGETIYKTIPGFTERFQDLESKVEAYHKVEGLWKQFLRTRQVNTQILNSLEEAKTVCEKGTLAKYFYMVAYQNYCDNNIPEAKDNFENRVLKLAERTSLRVSDIEGLEKEVADMKSLFIQLPKVGAAWKTFTTTGTSPGYDDNLPEYPCNPVPNIKACLLRGAADICGAGPAMAHKIRKLQAANPHPLDPVVAEKIEWLISEVKKNTGNVAALNQEWQAFVANGSLSEEPAYGYQYCDAESLIRAYILDGMRDFCEKGANMLQKIDAIRAQNHPQLEPATIEKIKALADRVAQSEFAAQNLDQLWSLFIQNQDTLTEPFDLADFYCDPVRMVKAWTIRGHLNPCDDGQPRLDQIDALQQKQQLQFDDELACRIRRLRIKVWDCRYWELVRQARAETHAERERFGPQSAEIMQKALNSEQQPCETTVEYEPLGYIGVKYIITTYLCQDIDLAKMGDPAYYKKIATWVDTEVLQKYCEEGLRCKEEFFIYLEGHTDGNAFRGARYKNSLDIPAGTPFTHFVNGDTTQTETTREITTSLRSNMELGLARAWTVKQQLDFMEVPITIGAWEHPASEKGGAFRRIEIELNITKLLLDFYEKRLRELLEASGIGARPDTC